jgi:hypothetical protein
MLTKLQYYRTVDCKEVKSAAKARNSCKIMCIRFSLIVCLLEPQSANLDSCMYISLMVAGTGLLMKPSREPLGIRILVLMHYGCRYPRRSGYS